MSARERATCVTRSPEQEESCYLRATDFVSFKRDACWSARDKDPWAGGFSSPVHSVDTALSSKTAIYNASFFIETFASNFNSV